MTTVSRGFLLWLVVGAASALAQSDPGLTRLSIDPNAILDQDQPLMVTVEGLPSNQRARIWVVEDCTGDKRPDDGPGCPPLYDGESELASEGVAQLYLDFAELRAKGKSFPAGVPLWLRAAKPGSPGFRQAVFGFTKDECSLFKTAVDVFLRGRCDPGLEQVLRRHRQPSDLAKTVFEVRRLEVDREGAEPVSMPGTRGASGVAWLDNATLLVTAAGVTEEGGLAAGVYRLKLASDALPEQLWSPADPEQGAVAPFSLPHGRIVFVRQKVGAQQAGANAEVAWLIVMKVDGRKVEREVPLPYKVHQLVAADPKGTAVLALSLGVAENQPVFLKVPLAGEGAEPEVVGFANALYQSLMREPGKERAVVAFENNQPGQGWQLALAEGPKFLRDLVKREDRHDLAPAWRPAGGEVAYLAQVGAPP